MTTGALRLSLLVLAIIGLAQPSARAAGGPGLAGGASEVTAPGSPYRYTALSPGTPGKLTVLARTDRRGGRVSRWWYLPGSYSISAVDSHGTGGGLSADGETLVLRRFSPSGARRDTWLAVLNTAIHLRHPGVEGRGREHAITRIELPGEYFLTAISPHGRTAFLSQYLPPRRDRPSRSAARFEIRALDTRSGRLLHQPIVNENAPGEPLRGLAISQVNSPDGYSYTLYDGGPRRRPFIEALDLNRGTAFRLDLPGLETHHDLFRLRLGSGAQGRLALLSGAPRRGAPPRKLMSIDVRRLEASLSSARASAVQPQHFLAFTKAPRWPGNLLLRTGVIGHSLAGRPIDLTQIGDPSIVGRVLVFDCIHGDECAARGRIEPLVNGCPDRRVDAFIVPDLDPDGSAAGSRLNSRGVDLNRNFPAGWRSIGSPGSLQYSGPEALSEPETRLAARLVRAIRPRVTIWFHQDKARGPWVRAWGQSRPAARRFARLAGIGYRSLPWPPGTAPNWQNHRFPGSASFVVELPDGGLAAALGARLDRAVDRVGREVGED